MVRGFKKHIVFFVCLLLVTYSFSQGHLSSSVSLSKNNVYVGEPVQVTVSVFTSTWFTKGVNPGNIKVNGAFTVYFRSLSTSKQIKGKTYAGVQLFFNVFPHENEYLEFPSLEIEVESPNEGDYKGVRHVVKTRPRTIKVKPIPSNFDADNWLVTSWMSASENWNGDLKNVKVGDVLERSVYRNASNTVSELIPPIKWDTIANVSLYPMRSSVKNNKTKTAISATRTEGTRYLFEKEGEVTIPKLELTWYNPYKKKLYKKTMPEVVINVQANPDLGMLATIKEQLEASKKTEEENEKNSAITIFGLSMKQFLVWLTIGLLSLYIFFKLVQLLLKTYRRKRAAYLISEKFYFDAFIKTIRTLSSVQIIPKLYRWIDELPLEESTLQNIHKHCEKSSFRKEINTVMESKNSTNLILKKSVWVLIRKQVLAINRKEKTVTFKNWINP